MFGSLRWLRAACGQNSRRFFNRKLPIFLPCRSYLTIDHGSLRRRGGLSVVQIFCEDDALVVCVYVCVWCVLIILPVLFFTFPLCFVCCHLKIHRIVRGTGLMGGDVENTDGRGGHSAFGSRFFPDEAFIIPHTWVGLLAIHETYMLHEFND